MTGIQKLIQETRRELDIKINQFNNVTDEELTDILIKELNVIEEKHNYYCKLAKGELNV